MVLLAVTTLVGSMISLAFLGVRTWIIGAAWVGVIQWVVAATIWHYVTARGDGRFAFVIAILTLELVGAAIWTPQRDRAGITWTNGLRHNLCRRLSMHPAIPGSPE
jgi:hypothetical protein